jgi:hypothetical protein
MIRILIGFLALALLVVMLVVLASSHLDGSRRPWSHSVMMPSLTLK